MGYLEILKEGVGVQMVDGEVVRVFATDRCDFCLKEANSEFGMYFNVQGLSALFACYDCRDKS